MGLFALPHRQMHISGVTGVLVSTNKLQSFLFVETIFRAKEIIDYEGILLKISILNAGNINVLSRTIQKYSVKTILLKDKKMHFQLFDIILY